MKLYIKYMVSNRCKMMVKSELEKLGLHYGAVELGEAEVKEQLDDAVKFAEDSPFAQPSTVFEDIYA